MSKKLKSILLWVLCIALAVSSVFVIKHVIATTQNGNLKNKQLDFAFQDERRQTVQLSSFSGPTVINFWAIWCPPCRNELPALQNAYDEYGDEVNFLFINNLSWHDDSVTDVKLFLEKNGYTFPTYYDVTGEAAEACGATSIPLTLFMDSNGKVVHTYSGAIPKATLNAFIKDIL